MRHKKIFTHSHKNRDDLTGEYHLGDKGQLILLVIYLAVTIIDLLLIKTPSYLSAKILPRIQISVGSIIGFFGVWFAMNGLKIIFGEERPEATIVDKEVFGIIRHPVYFGSILGYLAFLIFTLSLIARTVWIIVVSFYHFLAKYEEKLLIKRFGLDYENYMRRVPMWIPKIFRKS